MITVRTLGPIDVACDGAAPPPELLWRKHLALLVYLARSPRRARTREHLVGLLWGDRPDAAARHSLREAIRILRRCLGEDGVDTAGDDLRLAEGAVSLDVDELEAHVTAGRWDAAADLVAGDFLEGFAVPGADAFDDWLAAERLHWRGRAVRALAESAGAAGRAGHLAEALERGRRALQLDPASSAAARATMTAFALSGERGAALAAHEAHTARLEEMGIAPDRELTELAGRVRSGRTWTTAAAEREPRRGAESRRAPLEGRAPDLAAVLAAWEACRGARRAAIGVIEGETGVGKTRLAEEIVERARLAGAAVAAVRAVPTDAATPWAGAFALARGGLADAPGIGGASAEALAAFAARIPEWAERFPGARGAAPLATGAALVEVLRAATEDGPVVVLLDDAQWLDPAILDALAGLLRDLSAQPLFLLLTVASAPAHETLDALRVRVGRDVPGAVVRLAALPRDALHGLARWAFPHYTDVEVDRVARRIGTDSAGLPLLAVELLHAVALGLDLQGTSGAWPAEHRTLDATLPGDLPDAVVAAIRIGFRRLSKDAQAVLTAAAVLPEPAGAPLLGRASPLAPEPLAAALDELEWQRWLAADGRGYAFVARIVRDVVARDLLTAGGRRRILDAAGA